MGPQDHLAALLDGTGCTVCEAPVPADRVRLLARRDDLLFLQVDCQACGSTGLGFVADEPEPSEAERLARGAPVSSDDVLDMHAFLASWTGDLVALVQPDGAAGRPAADPAGRRRGRTA